MDFLSVLAAPGAVVGAVAGVAVAVLFHWLAPLGVDTTSAGAWFVGLGWLVGLLVSFGSRSKK